MWLPYFYQRTETDPISEIPEDGYGPGTYQNWFQVLPWFFPRAGGGGRSVEIWLQTYVYTFKTGFARVGFKVLTPVVMMNTIFWDITPCSPLKVNRCSGGICDLHLQGKRINQARNQHEPNGKKVLGGYMFFRNVGLLWTDARRFYWSPENCRFL
jgi:hypothetical protein